jgi:hypothetical protein
VVIGRPAYDNWVVLHAIQNDFVVVDVGQTALAVHQTTKYVMCWLGEDDMNNYDDDVMMMRMMRMMMMMMT